MAIAATHEIFTTRHWDMEPSSLHGYKQTIDENILARIPFIRNEEGTDRPYFLSSASRFQEAVYITQNNRKLRYGDLSDEDQVINVIRVEGPILRNGGDCSYGSKEHRDLIMAAADDKHVIGQIIVVDSPGGSSYAKYDYEKAINYFRSKGKPVIGLVDGMACSAGYAIMALCDEVYAVGEHDIVGCIGTMAAYYTNKDGDENSVTKERYVELYATGSPYKNKADRDASQGDYAELQKEIDTLCEDYQQLVRSHRSEVTEEQLKGSTYGAESVIGTLIDGMGNMQSCIDSILSKTKKPETSNAPVYVSAKNTVTNKKENMKEYPKTQAAMGLNALVSDADNGFYLTESMADDLEAYVADSEMKKSTLEAKLQEIKQLNELIETLKADNEKALADLKQEHECQMDSLKSSQEKEMNDLSDTCKQSLADKQKEIDELKQQLSEKEAEIEELSQTSSDAPMPAEAPKSNEMDAPKSVVENSVCNAQNSASENNKAWNDRMEELKRRMRG